MAGLTYKQLARWDYDTTGALGDSTKIWSYHPLSELSGTRRDVLDRVPLAPAAAMATIIGGGPSSSHLVVADFTDSTTAYLENSDVSDWWSTTTAFSYHVWARLDSLPAEGTYDLVLRRSRVTGGGGWGVYVNTTSGVTKVGFFFSDGGSSGFAYATTSLSINTWYAFGGSWDGTTRSVWVNGAGTTTDTPGYSPQAANSTTRLQLGYEAGGGNQPLDGRLADLALWRGYALTTARALELYNGGTPNRLRY